MPLWWCYRLTATFSMLVRTEKLKMVNTIGYFLDICLFLNRLVLGGLDVDYIC